jgi:hypothetical protein
MLSTSGKDTIKQTKNQSIYQQSSCRAAWSQYTCTPTILNQCLHFVALPKLFVCSIVKWHTARFRATGTKLFLELWKYFPIHDTRKNVYQTSSACPSDNSGVNVKMSTKNWYHTDRENWSIGRKTCPSANLSHKAWSGIEQGTHSEKLVCCHTANSRPSSKVGLDTRQKLGKEKR